MCAPSPLTARRNSAPATAKAPNIPPARSPIGSPMRTGALPASPAGVLDLDAPAPQAGGEHRTVRAREHAGEVEHAPAGEELHERAATAARTRSGVIGSSVKRTPIASCPALAPAADTGITPDSPR